MAYKAYLKDVVEYHGALQVLVEYVDDTLPDTSSRTRTFTYSFTTFSVAQAKSDILAGRDMLNAMANKVEQLRAFIGQEVT